MPKKPFKGIIKLDVRDSVPDWEPYLPAQAPPGSAEHPVRALRRHRSRRVVAVRRRHQHADAAEARRQRPDVLAVAHDGALLADPLDAPDRTQPSPERHGRITEGANGFPGANGRIPDAVRDDRRRSSRTAAGARSGSARTTTCPEQDVASGASRKQWPLQKGFDRFYGFLGGETNQWYPDLVEDNQFIDQPYTPGGGLPPLQGPGRPGASA